MIGRILNGLAAIGGAGTASQFPAFYQQYLQRLGGRADQARAQAERVQEAALSLGLSPEQYMQSLQTSAEAAARREAEVVAASLADAQSLTAAFERLAEAEPAMRPALFASHFDPSIAAATAESFQPALPLSVETLVYASLGMLLGLLLLAGGESGGKAAARKIRGKVTR
jgi:hypothetical protein